MVSPCILNQQAINFICECTRFLATGEYIAASSVSLYGHKSLKKDTIRFTRRILIKNLTITLLTLLVLGGCATYDELYLDWNYEGYQAKANTENRYFWDLNLVGYSETSQEEANQIALENCEKWKEESNIPNTSINTCLIDYEGKTKVWKESLEKHRQKVFEEALLSSVKRCIAYGFEGRVEIASCVQKEMNPSVSVVTDSTNNQEISSFSRPLSII